MEKSSLALHRSIQQFIYEKLPKNEAFLEYRMSRHIADVAWISKRIIFEIQCSPLPLEVAVERTTDYEKMDFSPVWILHTKTFHKRHITPVELYLRSKVCYYTNLNTLGFGTIFDQKEEFQEGKRLFLTPPIPIDIAHPKRDRQGLYFHGAPRLSLLPTTASLKRLYDNFLFKCLQKLSR